MDLSQGDQEDALTEGEDSMVFREDQVNQISNFENGDVLELEIVPDPVTPVSFQYYLDVY